jgi:hypothetical protein
MALIRDIVVYAGRPEQHQEIFELARQCRFALDRAAFHFRLADDDPRFLENKIKGISTYSDLHDGERIHLVAGVDEWGPAQRLSDRIRTLGDRREVSVDVRLQLATAPRVSPTAILWKCGDGRRRFWESFMALTDYFGDPLVVSLPGEEQWLRDHPLVVPKWKAWEQRQQLPRIVVKHANCGYRGFQGPPELEREAALNECSDPQTTYLWQPLDGNSYFEVLREPLKPTGV